jgi:hypothetical protein
MENEFKPNSNQMKHPEKWYIPVTEENRDELNRWRQRVATSHREDHLRPDDSVVVSAHHSDSSYYFSSNAEDLKKSGRYDDYQEITLEQFREITNPHPEHWCIEATDENFKELYAWWRNNASERCTHFQVGYTLVSDHPCDESKYYGGAIAQCLNSYPQFVEITLEQFREITNSNQTPMSKQIQISRNLLNEYYEAATIPQKEYLTEHFKLDGTTTDEAIRGLHELACSTWKPKIKKNHPDCFPVDSKYFNFSKHVRNSNMDKFIISGDVGKSLGLGNDFIQVRNSNNPELDQRSFYLTSAYNWELVQDDNATVLIPTKK